MRERENERIPICALVHSVRNGHGSFGSYVYVSLSRPLPSVGTEVERKPVSDYLCLRVYVCARERERSRVMCEGITHHRRGACSLP